MTDEVRTIRLYGKLGSRFGRVHQMAVESMAEAIRALSTLLPGFSAYMTQAKDRGEAYAVFYGRRNLCVEECAGPAPEGVDIRIAPVIMGAKKQGWGSIIAGAILIIVGYALSGYTGGASMILVKYGWGLVIGGVVQLLTPTPKTDKPAERTENTPGYAFNGPINTQAQGHPVSVLYGELIVGSAVLSAGISVVDQAIVPAGGGGGDPSKWGGGSAPWHLEWVTQVQ
jgi:predicted phage tail protein